MSLEVSGTDPYRWNGSSRSLPPFCTDDVTAFENDLLKRIKNVYAEKHRRYVYISFTKDDWKACKKIPEIARDGKEDEDACLIDNLQRIVFNWNRLKKTRAEAHIFLGRIDRRGPRGTSVPADLAVAIIIPPPSHAIIVPIDATV